MKSRGSELVHLGEREYFVLMNFINIECIDTVRMQFCILIHRGRVGEREREREREREQNRTTWNSVSTFLP